MGSVLDLVAVALLTGATVLSVCLIFLRPDYRERWGISLGSSCKDSFVEPPAAGSFVRRYGTLVSVVEAPLARAERVRDRLRAAGISATLAPEDTRGLVLVLIFPDDRLRALALLDTASL